MSEYARVLEKALLGGLARNDGMIIDFEGYEVSDPRALAFTASDGKGYYFRGWAFLDGAELFIQTDEEMMEDALDDYIYPDTPEPIILPVRLPTDAPSFIVTLIQRDLLDVFHVTHEKESEFAYGQWNVTRINQDPNGIMTPRINPTTTFGGTL